MYSGTYVPGKASNAADALSRLKVHLTHIQKISEDIIKNRTIHLGINLHRPH